MELGCDDGWWGCRNGLGVSFVGEELRNEAFLDFGGERVLGEAWQMQMP